MGYTFEPLNAWDRTLRNQQPDAPEFTNGSVVGAQWAQGRWRGKQALAFKSPGDRVRLAVAGEYDAITLAAWVQVGGVDRNYNSLFLTDTWTHGNPHWQIIRSGAVAWECTTVKVPASMCSTPLFYLARRIWASGSMWHPPSMCAQGCCGIS
ncbi:hypothetical protein [Verrucomicrobium spinosum]|uniref:hypothetical protein n=1 Tax=Verrucomicrobium spinosum TaxID=2736 RepID=UPI00210921B5|nr:hypothetical protein [Verrucomicrobium spinosum]